MTNSMIRTGFGFDTHKFIDSNNDNNTIKLCGIEIPYSKALSAHSDGDLALHALTDALLGALGEEDIGMFFPPTDPKWKNADSTLFLKHAYNLLLERSGSINNIDVTIITERPKLMDYKYLMKNNIAALLKIKESQISIKAKTSEKLGFIGRGEGMSAYAVCTIMIPID
jgi:2-C-methyl-D-erythritol 4-phosphate cytidylyltransferase/2-C-methyl-D-erythritol 2,4-cyclodiphosphate synthase